MDNIYYVKYLKYKIKYFDLFFSLYQNGSGLVKFEDDVGKDDDKIIKLRRKRNKAKEELNRQKIKYLLEKKYNHRKEKNTSMKNFVLSATINIINDMRKEFYKIKHKGVTIDNSAGNINNAIDITYIIKFEPYRELVYSIISSDSDNNTNWNHVVNIIEKYHNSNILAIKMLLYLFMEKKLGKIDELDMITITSFFDLINEIPHPGYINNLEKKILFIRNRYKIFGS